MPMTGNDFGNFSNLIVEALKAKGISLGRLSELSGVPESTISLLLEERFDKLPAAPYVHGYLVKIGEVLGIDGQTVWSEYLKNKNEIRKPGEKDTLPPNRFEIARVNKKLIGVIIVVALFLIYIAIRLPGILGIPTITFGDLSSGITITKDQNFTIKGTVSPGSKLSMNGESLTPDADGVFEKLVVLNPGFNTFDFTAAKVLGKNYSVTKQVYYEAGIAPATSQTSTETASSSSSANAH